ncbi:hypothetical protein B7494_g6304 [Chlorociboria aeruginascens]|nr:hypothetical protein B7494_g6304 [Chlorociboria aeruginascens]
MATYQNIIIGSGQAGNPLAVALSKAGQKTILIEKSHIGGCCINEGCTPTKTMIASGRAAYLTRRGQDYGIHTSSQDIEPKNEVFVDMLKVRQRKRDIVDQFRGGSEARLKDAGVEVLMGEGRFRDSKAIIVKREDGSEKTIVGENIFINVGERPMPLKIEGLEGIEAKRILDSTSAQELDEVPEHLVVIGGGYVGVEFAQLYRRLGAEVTIIQRGTQLLPREDKDIADTMLGILVEDGIAVHLESVALRILSSSANGIFNLTIGRDQTEKTISGSHILLVTGRIPNTSTLNLPAAGIKTNSRNYIITNEYLETSTPNIYALGDVKGPPAFTHLSYDDFRIIKANLLPSSSSVPKLSIKNRLVPYVVYTDPQLAHIGLHHAEAVKQFPTRNIKMATMPMRYVARALEIDESRGVMRGVVDGETGEILGFTCLGVEGGEVMSVVQMAMIGGVRYLEEHPEGRLVFKDQSYWEVVEWMTWMQSGIGPMQTRRLYQVLEDRLTQQKSNNRTAAGTPAASAGPTPSQNQSPGPWIVGDKCTIADLACFSWVNWAEWAGIVVEEFQEVKGWVDRINERPAVKRGLDVPEPFTMKEKMKTKEGEDEYQKYHSNWVMKGQEKDQERHK